MYSILFIIASSPTLANDDEKHEEGSLLFSVEPIGSGCSQPALANSIHGQPIMDRRRIFRSGILSNLDNCTHKGSRIIRSWKQQLFRSLSILVSAAPPEPPP